MDRHFYIADLIAKKIQGKITLEEAGDLQKWLTEDQANANFFERISSNQHLLSQLEIYQMFDKDKAWALLEPKVSMPKVVQFNARKLLRYAAAILLPLLIGGLSWYLFNPTPEDSLASIDTVIQPGVQKATLVLADGGIVDLQAETSEKKIRQGNALITNQNHALNYVAESGSGNDLQLVFNDLKTPRGGGYQLKLADGTKVWLNAASALKFPVAFTDSTRQVFLEGEAYFEVAHNGKPFIVSSEEQDIRVLGTSFNVSAYSGELYHTTTLVEGSIQLLGTGIDQVLVPNEQALLERTNAELKVKEVNTNIYTSWVRGKIEFDNDNLESVMRKLSRWYDFEYSFENNQAKNYHFTGRIENTQSISSILDMLELTTNVRFELEGKTILIF